MRRFLFKPTLNFIDFVAIMLVAWLVSEYSAWLYLMIFPFFIVIKILETWSNQNDTNR